MTMGKKYLETKSNTLESSILNVWKDAAKLDEYKTKLGEKKRVSGGDNRRTENIKEGTKEEYEKFFNAAMKKFKINSPADLKSDEEKKKFFDYVDKNYKGEKSEEAQLEKVKEFKVNSMREALAKVWGMEEGLEDSPNKANSQHLCAKNVVHEEWGEGQPVHGMHAEPDFDGDIAWYDVMFEHGIEKGVSINELKVQSSESHHDHGDKKKKKVIKSGKTMTGEKPAEVEINPKIDA